MDLFVVAEAGVLQNNAYTFMCLVQPYNHSRACMIAWYRFALETIDPESYLPKVIKVSNIMSKDCKFIFLKGFGRQDNYHFPHATDTLSSF